MLNIGLMMVRNEVDIIEEVMNEHIKYFDKIFVLDGSDDGSSEIIKQYNEVVFYIRDEDTGYNLIRDGARKILLENAQKLYGFDGWFTLIHGDEIFHDDPNMILHQAEKENVEVVKWESFTFFLHKQDAKIRIEKKSVQESLKWYCRGWIEFRQFKNKQGIYYDIHQHGYVLPQEIDHHNTCSVIPIYKHYPYRFPEQMKSRAIDRFTRKFQSNYKWIIETEENENLFIDNLKLWENSIVGKWD